MHKIRINYRLALGYVSPYQWYFTPLTPHVLHHTTSQLSVLHDQTLHKVGKFYMKFGHLIFRKICKFVAARCHAARYCSTLSWCLYKLEELEELSDFKAKMHQIRFRLGIRPRPAGELTALPRPLAGFKGPTSKGGERKG